MIKMLCLISHGEIKVLIFIFLSLLAIVAKVNDRYYYLFLKKKAIDKDVVKCLVVF